MKRVVRVLIAVLVAGLGSCCRTSAAPGGAEAFAQLKSLVGHWEEQKPSEHRVTLDIQLTAGGTALLERFHLLEQGKSVEMITSYAPEAKTLTFDFENATNLNSPSDGHMHHAVYTFLDADHFKTTWTFQKDQKEAFSEDAVYVRK